MGRPDFPSRMKKLRTLMESQRLDACLISSRNDILYYTGKDIGDSCHLLVSKSRPVIFATSLSNEIEPTREADVVFINGIQDISKRLKRFRKVGFDEYSTNYAVFSQLRKSKPALKPSTGIIKEPRMVKDGYEIAQIEKAADIVRKAITGTGLAGKSELDVSWQIQSSFRRMGAKPSFETIVASGRRSAFVHHSPENSVIGRSDLVIIDAGAAFNGYCSDMTRTLCAKPAPKERKIMENVSGIQKELIGMAVEGAKYDDIQKRYELLLKRSGYKLMHSFGHGIGIGVHERPSKGDILKAGMVITVEPGAYIKGFGGCRMEDMVLVRKGSPRILTTLKEGAMKPEGDSCRLPTR
jgi:Xaa-Pro aminopeptidase